MNSADHCAAAWCAGEGLCAGPAGFFFSGTIDPSRRTICAEGAVVAVAGICVIGVIGAVQLRISLARQPVISAGILDFLAGDRRLQIDDEVGSLGGLGVIGDGDIDGHGEGLNDNLFDRRLGIGLFDRRLGIGKKIAQLDGVILGAIGENEILLRLQIDCRRQRKILAGRRSGQPDEEIGRP